MKYYRLTQDVPNTQHDKRHKHGIKSVPTFKAGSLIREREESYGTQYDIKLRYWQNLVYQKKHTFIQYLEPVPLEGMSLKEAAAMEWVDYSTFCEVVVETLVKEGKLTPVDALATFQRSDDETES